MNETEIQLLKKALDDNFNLKKQTFDHEMDRNFSLLMAQLDLFKVISALSLAIVVGVYTLTLKIDSTFSLISVFFSLFTIIGTIAYTRETIDATANNMQKDSEVIRGKINLSIDKIMEAKQQDDFKVFNEFAKSESDKIAEITTNRKQDLMYTGEIFTFTFFLSIAFGFLAFIKNKYQFDLISCQTIITIFIAYFLSFKSWSMELIKLLSKLLSSISK